MINIPVHSLIHDAIQRPENAEEVIRNIETQLGLLVSNGEKAELVLGGAVLAGVIHRFDYAREQLRLATEYAPDDPGVRMQVDFISACMYDEEGKSVMQRA